MSCKIVLASASRARAHLLRAAGVAFDTRPSSVDESKIKKDMAARAAAPISIAAALAEEKARAIAAPEGALVIGADQILSLDGEIFDKPATIEEARARLARLAGRAHRLETAAAIVRGGAVIWRHESRPEMKMRPLASSEIDAYLADVGDSVLSSVGAYRLEDRGARLFEAVRGDYFAILGLPLIEILAALRELGCLENY